MVEGQGILALGIIKGLRVVELAEGLRLDEEQIHLGGHGLRGGLGPGSRLPGIVALRLQQGVELVVVEETVEEARLIKDLGHVGAVEPLNASDQLLIQSLVRVNRGHGPHKEARAKDQGPNPKPDPGPAFELQAQKQQPQGHQENDNPIGNVQIQPILSGGHHGLPQQLEVSRHQGVLAAFHFDEIYQGKAVEQQGTEGACPEQIAQKRPQQPQQGHDREEVQQQQPWLVEQVAQGVNQVPRLQRHAEQQHEAGEPQIDQPLPKGGEWNFIGKKLLHHRRFIFLMYGNLKIL